MEAEKSSKALPAVVLVGRVNVGKSTLFNRLLGAPHSLVSPVPGTTRDTQEALVTWRGVAFSLLDTGGLDASEEPTGVFTQVIARAQQAVERADLILFITEAKDGMLPSDRHAANALRRRAGKVITVVNKADNPALRAKAPEFSRLGFGEPAVVSAINGSGTGDLLDRIVDTLRRLVGERGRSPLPLDERQPIRLAIIGKPNVGKSTLVNAFLGYERVIVSPHAHTTREPVDTPLTWNDTPMVLIDTAGIRRKARVERGLEHAGVTRSIAVLERADVALFVIDIAHGIDDQDKQLASMVERSGVGLVLVLNKWDLVRLAREHNDHSGNNVVPERAQGESKDIGAYYLKYIYGKLPFLTWAPVVFASALNASHVKGVMDAAVHAAHAQGFEVPIEELTMFFSAFRSHHLLPPLGQAKRKPALVHFKQTNTRPPSFELAVKTKERFPEAYLHLLEKELRKQYDFEGTPMRITVKTVR